MAMDFKNLTDYVPVMVAAVGVVNTLVKYALKKGNPKDRELEPMDEKSDTADEHQTDLDLITAQLDEILNLLKAVAKEGKRQAELEAYLERCKEEKEGVE